VREWGKEEKKLKSPVFMLLGEKKEGKRASYLTIKPTKPTSYKHPTSLVVDKGTAVYSSDRKK
jgi:hypothetical protein